MSSILEWLSTPAHGVLVRILLLVTILLYLVLFGINSLHYQRKFSYDSLNYVDVARHIVAGRGINQATLGFNEHRFVLHTSLDAPLTVQPPLYPLLIALFSYVGIPCTTAALFIPLLCYGGILLITYAFIGALYYEAVALISVACLLFFYPLRKIALYAWSEAPGVVFILLSLYILISVTHLRGIHLVLVPVAGLLAGLAFATRYVFFLVFCVGSIILCTAATSWLTIAVHLGAYTAGFALPSVLVVGRNLRVSGTLMGGGHNPTTVGVGPNIRDTCLTLLGNYLSQGYSILQIILLTLSFTILGIVLTAQRHLLQTVEEIVLLQTRYALILWSLSYLALILYLRSHMYFDHIDTRLTVPASITLVPIWAALLVSAGQLNTQSCLMLALITALLALLRESWNTWRMRTTHGKSSLPASERWEWIQQHTTVQDFIIGEDTVDIAFHLQRDGIVSFSPYPNTEHFTYERLKYYVHLHGSGYHRIFLVLRKRFQHEETWQRFFGPFIADLAAGRSGNYPGIIPHRQLADGYIFEISLSELREEKL